jgi:hypothetical protein
MAATVAASKSYDLSGGALREDLQNMIYDITPMDTWALTTFGRSSCKSTTHEWLTDALGSSAANHNIEGNDFAAVARTLPSRLKNYTSISRKDFEVTGTAQAVDNAGMATLLAYHTGRAAKELKRDIETSILGNYPASAGTSVSPRFGWCAELAVHEQPHQVDGPSGCRLLDDRSGVGFRYGNDAGHRFVCDRVPGS